MHKYTDEEHAFLRDFIPGHTYVEIAEAFNKKFGLARSQANIKSYMGNNKLRNGLKGYFKKGHVPYNKGRKGYCSPGCEKTWFKKGHIPKNYRPVGSERVTQDGYVEIKVSDPNEWELKHRVVWEEANGPINKDECLLFRDNNRQNCCIDNLILVKRYEQVRMNQDGLFRFVGEEKDVAVNIARLKSLTRRRQRNK